MDLQKTQNEWTGIFREFGIFLKVLKFARDARGRFWQSQNKAVREFGEGGNLGPWNITGIVIGTNTDPYGILYGKITDETPGVGQATFQLYKDSARTALVADGFGGDNNTVTISPQNNSGLGGSVVFGTIPATDNDWRLVIFQDFLISPAGIFAITAIGQEAMLKFLDLVRSMNSILRQAESGALSSVENGFIETRFADFLLSTQSGAVTPIEDVDDGTVTVRYDGILSDLVENMNDELLAPPQTVLKCTASASLPVIGANNVGFGVFSPPVVEEYARPGLVRVECTDELLAHETFTVNHFDYETSEVTTAQNVLSMSRPWKSVDIGISLLYSRGGIEIGDGGNQLTPMVFAGATKDNSDDGIFYITLTNSGAIRTVKVYKNASLTPASEVASGSRTGDGVVVLESVNGSGLTASTTVTYTTDDLSISVDAQVFKLGDVVTFEIINDQAGKLQTLVGNTWKIALPSAAAGLETITDGVVSEGMTVLFEPHVP